jgi:hypothetical protein
MSTSNQLTVYATIGFDAAKSQQVESTRRPCIPDMSRARFLSLVSSLIAYACSSNSRIPCHSSSTSTT